MRSGTYVAAMLARTDSMTPRAAALGRNTTAGATLAANPQPRRRGGLWALGLLVVGVVVLVAFLTSRTPINTPPTAASPPVSASTPAALSVETPLPVITSVAPIASSAPSAAVSAALSVTAKGGHAPKYTGGAKAPSITVKETATATAAPPPPPPPATTVPNSEDPLGDRQ
jgi:hypothetical protein